MVIFMDNNLILHIGLPKTGTTSLQRFFIDNKKNMNEAGINYPAFTQQLAVPTLRNGSFLFKYLKALVHNEDPNSRVKDLENNITMLADALHSQKRVLISEENLSLGGSWWPKSKYWQELARFLDNIGAHRSTIVIYLRRQDNWAVSRWKENVKNGMDKSFKDWCALNSSRSSMDYSNIIMEIKEVFRNSVNIVGRRYDRKSFLGGDIFHDFCSAAGIPWISDYNIPRKEENVSLTFDVTEAIRSLGTIPYESYEYQRIILPLACKLSQENPDPLDMSLMTENESRSFMKAYNTGNQQISDAYLDGKPLFSTDFTVKSVWQPDFNRIDSYRCAFERAIQSYYNRE